MNGITGSAMDKEIVVDPVTTLGVEYEGKWTQAGVSRLQEWIDEAALASACHNEASNFFNLMFRSIGTSNIIAAAGASALSFLSVSNDCASTPKLSVLTVFSALAVVSAAVNAFFGWNLRSLMHIIMSNEYSTLSKDLQYQLALPMHARDDILVVFARTSAKLKEINMRSPLLPPWIVSQVTSGRRGCCAWLVCKRRSLAVESSHV